MNTRVINIIGVHQRVEGYPNVLFLLNGLEKDGVYDYKEFNFPMWSGSLSSKKSIIIKMRNMLKAFYAHIKIFFYFLKSPEIDRVYIPYPALFIAFLLVFLPKKKRPDFVVIDAFISVYDTVVNDRKLFTQESWIARLIKIIEKIAFKQANVVITDTYQNSLYLSELFQLPLEKFKNLPLSTDEKHFNLETAKSHKIAFEVIFIGTLIPLHGIEVIVKASNLLASYKDIQFTIIGDGQMSGIIEEAVSHGESNLHWIREWQSSESLASALSQASLALGIFGTGDKTQRVCPFKLYAYMACGLPVITGDTRWTRQIMGEVSYSPLLTIPVGDHEKLAEAILQCYTQEESLKELAVNSRSYYESQLTNKKAIQQFEDLFFNESADLIDSSLGMESR